MKKNVTWILFILLLVFSALGGAIADRLWVIRPLDGYISRDGDKVERVYQTVEVQDMADLVEVVSKSVVTVSIKGVTEDRVTFDWWSMDFQRQTGREYQQDIGSGFVVDDVAGLVVTNRHVVAKGGVEYKIVSQDGEEYVVTDIYKDRANDLAILKVESMAGKIPQVDLADTNSIRVGQKVLAIGTALGEFRNTVTYGIVSGLGRGIRASDSFAGVVEKMDNLIQTDAAINPGNSGGPLLNMMGQVIGVNTAVVGGAQGIGFALPVGIVSEALERFDKTGGFERAVFGVEYKIVDKRLAVLNDLPTGAFVVRVIEGGVAQKAGVLANDIILSIDGVEVSESADQDLGVLIEKYKKGDRVEVKIYRDGQEQRIRVVF
jgi:S1-C subfamily serine protease